MAVRANVSDDGQRRRLRARKDQIDRVGRPVREHRDRPPAERAVALRRGGDGERSGRQINRETSLCVARDDARVAVAGKRDNGARDGRAVGGDDRSGHRRRGGRGRYTERTRERKSQRSEYRYTTTRDSEHRRPFEESGLRAPFFLGIPNPFVRQRKLADTRPIYLIVSLT